MKKSTERPRRPRASRAFTLLEVLAAVAILGIWFSVLASVAIQGQRSEGENERRVRASLIADEILSDLELGFDRGEFPDETPEESKRDEFEIRIESLPFSDLELLESDPGLTELLEDEMAAIAPDLYTVIVTVSWIEGTSEERVTRTTYAWDSEPLLAGIDQDADEGAEEGQEGAQGLDP